MPDLLEACGLYADNKNQALICRECKYALTTAGSQVTTHLDKKHGIPAHTRKGLTKYIRDLPRPFKDPGAIPLRPNGSSPHPELQVHKGYACRECPEPRFYTTSLKWLMQHFSKIHLQERASKPRIDSLYNDVFLQTWGDGPRRAYWMVSVNGSMIRPTNVPDAHGHLASVYKREEARRKERKYAGLTDTGAQMLQSTGPWMERTCWPVTYQGVRRDLLLSLADPPTSYEARDYPFGESNDDAGLVSPRKDEERIWHLTSAIHNVLDRCEETMRRTGRPILCWLITTRSSPCFPKPFKFLGRENTRRSYRRWLRGFISFVFRAYRMDPTLRTSLAGIQFNKRQLECMKNIWEHTLWRTRPDPNMWAELRTSLQSTQGTTDQPIGQQAFGGEEGDEEEDGDEDLEEEEDLEGEEEEDGGEEEDGEEIGLFAGHIHRDKESSQTHQAAAEVLELLFQLCITFMTEEFRDGQPGSSLLVYYSGVLGLLGNGETFRTAKLFTPILSQLIYIQRLLFLEYALPYQAYPKIGLDRRPHQGQRERLDAVRLKYMVEGSMFPLAEFQSLRDFGRVLARTDPPSFLFRWSDDGQMISHSDHNLSMDSFRDLSGLFLDNAERVCRELMFDWLPEVDLSNIKDDLNNITRGFSFVQHPANHLSKAYLELSKRACTIRRHRLFKEGRWNWKAIFDYLKKEESLLEELAGVLYTTGGQVPRASELFGLECENGSASARGIYVYSGHVIYLIRHHKAKRSTNREFYVVRYLPVRASHILYYYLVYIRPLVTMLRQERQEDSTGHHARMSGNTFLFHSEQAPDCPWESRRLTAVLQRASSQVWGWTVNTQLCRQLTIAITEKHVKEVHRRFNLHDDRSPDADMNVVFAWQSGHRPLQRAATYGLDGAFPTQLQPALLRAYEWASMRWHEFLHQMDKVPPSGHSMGNRRAQMPLLMLEEANRQGQQTSHKRQPNVMEVLEQGSTPTKKRKSQEKDTEMTSQRVSHLVPSVRERSCEDEAICSAKRVKHLPPIHHSQAGEHELFSDKDKFSDRVSISSDRNDDATTPSREPPADVQSPQRVLRTLSKPSTPRSLPRNDHFTSLNSSKMIETEETLGIISPIRPQQQCSPGLSVDEETPMTASIFYQLSGTALRGATPESQAQPTIGCQHFDHLVEYQLAICKKCKYAVWPDQIQSHLQRSHKMTCKQAGLIAKEVRDWPGLIQYPSELEKPDSAIKPLAQLPLYPDGRKCELEPARCQRILRSTEVMRKHWRAYHGGWSAATKPGRPRLTQTKSVQERMSSGCRKVYCQRFFSSRHGSQYFEVQAPVEEQVGVLEPVAVHNEAPKAG